MQIPTYEALLIPPNATFETAHDPLRVVCKNSEDYIVKADHSKSYHSDFGFINEFLVPILLKKWEIACPEIAFINIRRELITEGGLPSNYNSDFYEKLCFGSKVVSNSEDFNNILFNLNDSSFINQFSNPLDFIKIGLLDIWIHNHDRKKSHSNLVIGISNHLKTIYPIDHYQAFSFGYNNSILHPDLLLDSDHTILNSKLIKTIFKRSIPDYPLRYWKEYFYDNIELTKPYLCEILDYLARNLNFNISNTQKLEEFLFNDKRNKKVFETFLFHLV